MFLSNFVSGAKVKNDSSTNAVLRNKLRPPIVTPLVSTQPLPFQVFSTGGSTLVSNHTWSITGDVGAVGEEVMSLKSLIVINPLVNIAIYLSLLILIY